MKFDLSKEDKKQLNNALESNPVRRWFLNKENLKFEIGDVLVKYHKHVDYQTRKESWKLENIQSNAKLAQRYVYVHEDEFGIGYIKPLRVSDGTLGKELSCLVDFDYSSTKFQVDPEYAEKVLLDGDFDIKQIHKASLVQRKIVTKMKIGFKPKSLKDYNDFFDKLKKGDTFWVSSDYTGSWVDEIKITSLTKTSVSDLTRENSWEWRRYTDRIKDKGLPPIDSNYAYKMASTTRSRESLVVEYHNYVFYTTKPAQEEEK
jgi:hypothetical protein